MQAWWRLTAFGDSTVILPMAAAVALLLLARGATRRAGWLWVLAVLVDGGVIVVSKILYMGWGLHPPGLDFTGVSGHSAMSFLFWPVVGALATGRLHAWHWLGVVAGTALAAGVAASRLAVHVHSPSEVLLGSLCGALLATVFLILTRGQLRESVRYGWCVVFLLIPPLLMTPRFDFPSHRILAYTAKGLTGHGDIYTRTSLDGRRAEIR